MKDKSWKIRPVDIVIFIGMAVNIAVILAIAVFYLKG